jgi:hypothetical protein
MSDTPLPQIVPNFDILSFMAGTNLAFSEAVGLGVKKLALSSPYSPEQLDVMMEVTRYSSQRFRTVYLPEPNLLESMLFPRDIARGKTVVLIAHDQSVLDEYAELKCLKERSDSMGNPEDMELEIARRFGRLLSYDEAGIEGLIAKHG